MCLLQNNLPENNIICYEVANAAESIKKIGTVLMSIIESVDKERVSIAYVLYTCLVDIGTQYKYKNCNKYSNIIYLTI